jgi:hypothetical protein
MILTGTGHPFELFNSSSNLCVTAEGIFVRHMGALISTQTVRACHTRRTSRRRRVRMHLKKGPRGLCAAVQVFLIAARILEEQQGQVTKLKLRRNHACIEAAGNEDLKSRTGKSLLLQPLPRSHRSAYAELYQ